MIRVATSSFYHIPVCLILLMLLRLKTILVYTSTLYSGELPTAADFQRLSECKIFTVVGKAIKSLNASRTYQKISSAELQTKEEKLTDSWQSAKFRPSEPPGWSSSLIGYI